VWLLSRDKNGPGIGQTKMTVDLSSPRKQRIVFFLVAVLVAASMWFYVDRILVGYQIADAAAHDRPRGNLSDLYPRWLGAQQLLRHHRNPYGGDITVEIQKGYYGRALDPALPNDPKDRQGFAYPVYVVFLLAPLIDLPFEAVQNVFHWFLIGLTGASVWWWLRGMRWRLPLLVTASAIVLTLGSFAEVQGIKLQQLSLLVGALLAASMACVAGGFLFWGGALLALATIKPQLAWFLVAWLLLWAVSDWRKRKRLILGFGLVMALLLAGAEIMLPGWWHMFADAIANYHQYTQNQSVIDVILTQVMGEAANGTVGCLVARAIAVVAVLVCVPSLWKLRTEPATASGFNGATALVLALTVLVVPMYAPYNQVLLIPSILLLIRERSRFVARSRIRRWGYLFAAIVVGWQWAASLCLASAYLLVSRTWALDAWQWPFFATFALPVWVFALIFFYVQDGREHLHAAAT
jgi:hypothetical protein